MSTHLPSLQNKENIAFTEACRSIRQYADHDLRVSEGNAAIIIRRATSAPKDQIEIYRSAICGQALINSNKAAPLSKSLISKISELTFEDGTEAQLGPISEMLEASLFEVYRDADPLRFEKAGKYICQIEEAFERELAAPTAYGDRTIYYALHFGLTPLLHTEHQRDVARLATKILETWDKRKWFNVMPALRLDKLRQMVLQPRLILDSTAISDLRSAAAKQASRQADGSTASLGDDSPSYYRYTRNLVLSMRYDEVLEKLRSDATKATADHTQNDFINFISFTHESALQSEVIVSAEEHFRKMNGTPPGFQYLTMCRRLAYKDRGLSWIKHWDKVPARANRRFVEAAFYNSIGMFEEALDMTSRVLSTFSSACRTEKFGEVQSAVLYRITREAHSARFFCDIKRIADNDNQPEVARTRTKTDTSLVLVPAHVNFTLQMPIHAIEHAKSLGAEVSCIVRGMYPTSDNLHPATLLLDQSLIAPYFFRADRASHSVSPDWKINVAKRTVIYKGVEYYPGLMNSLGIIFRRFTIDFNDPLVAAQVDRHLVMFQSAHDLFDEFVRKSEPNLQYRFAVVGIQYGIGYALRQLIEKSGMKNLRILHIANGFEGFDAKWNRDPFSGNPTASFHSVTDLTDSPKTPLGFRPTPRDVNAYQMKAAQSGGVKANTTAKAYIDKVTSRYEKAEPYPLAGLFPEPEGWRRHLPFTPRPRIVMMLGTVLPDLSIPEDRGFIHRDLVDWVEATVRIAERKNLRIIVKQHPAEQDHKVGYYVAQRFADLVPKSPRHVAILPYEVDFYAALKASDFVTMWAGTSAIELALLGTPFVCCSEFANEEYPLGVPGPQSEADYAAMLTGKKRWQGIPDAYDLVTSNLNMTTSSPLREPGVMPKRQLLNAQVWPPRVDPNAPLDDATIRLAKRLLGAC